MTRQRYYDQTDINLSAISTTTGDSSVNYRSLINIKGNYPR